VTAVPLLVLGVLAANDVDVFTTLSAHTLQVVVSVYCPFSLLVVSCVPSISAANCSYLATVAQLLDGTSDLHSSCLLESDQALCRRCDGSGERHLRHSADERVGRVSAEGGARAHGDGAAGHGGCAEQRASCL
jgi:hypothetical protein